MVKILVFGAGSIGIFLGTKLYNAGHNVNLYGRRKLQSLTDPILINGEIYKLPPRLYQLKSDDYDVIFVTTKLYDIQKALQEIEQYNFNPQLIVFIQNGIVDPDFYGQFQTHPGLVTCSVFNGYNLSDNQLWVRESELGWQVENSSVGNKICKLFKTASINCNNTDDLANIRAKKLIVNSALNALSAIEKKTVGELIANQNTKEIVDGIIQESWEVLKNHYHLPNLDSLRESIYELIQKVSEHYTSMYQDLISKRKTEIEFLNGLIIKLGKAQKIPTPYNQQVYLRVKEQEKSNRNPI
jgi:2-dehydropantoate 2-reductase